MPAENHPAYHEELERCKYTLNYVEKSLKNTLSKKDHIDKNLESSKKHFNAESSQDYIDIIVGSTLQQSTDLKLRNLLAARNKPYFARIDFNEDGKHKPETLYIGKMCLSREEDQQLIIIDWRAPIANLYYEGRLGTASYHCPDGQINGELKIKRQFSINDGILQEIFDIDITTNDEFLQSYLGASADNRLKDIVSTIQAEQNTIIRADMWKPLIVQGAAGSGKTTIALHRIAYLIYTYEKSFVPENFMIIAPNKLFLNYISEVLPELGVEKVKQTTFEEFAMELLEKKFKIRDANEKLTSFVDRNDSSFQFGKNEMIRRCSELKASIIFKNIIDNYISQIEKNFIPHEDFRIESHVVYSYKEINNLFLNEYKRWPILQRINEIKKHLSNRLRLQKDAIINRLHDNCYKEIDHLKLYMEDGEDRQRLIVQAIDKKNDRIAKLDQYSKKAVKEYVSRISKLNPFQYYMELVSDTSLFAMPTSDVVDPDLAEFTRNYTYQVLKSGFVEIEDIAPIMYLKYRIYGVNEKIPVKHIVIDEAQDFSVFQLYVLKNIVKDSSFTILGDLCQGIHSYRGIKDWKDVEKYVFQDRRIGFLTLEQSYRTTVEIMDAANKVIDKLDNAELIKARPVIRHGEDVNVIKTENIKSTASNIADRIKQYLNDGFKSIAVICKTMSECKEMHSLLKKSIKDIIIITGKEAVYKSGIVIVPSYLSKGLEFDIVMIGNCSNDEYKANELDIKLLYVAMTRPLHKLIIFYNGKPSPLIEEI